MKILKKIAFGFLANLIFYLHIVIIVIIHLGWLFPNYRIAYLIFLALVLVQHRILGYCTLTPWEFYFRKKINPNLNNSKSSFTLINMKRFLGIVVTENCVNVYSRGFLMAMIFLQLILLLF